MERLTRVDQDRTDGRLRPPSRGSADVRYRPGVGLARKLGWFSIALGMAELVAPRAVEQLSGVRSANLLRAYGLREIAAGVGILSSKRPAGWLWARVAGDGLDLATLAVPLCSSSPRRRKQAMGAALAVAGVTLADVMCASQLSAAAALEGSGYRRAEAGEIAEADASDPSTSKQMLATETYNTGAQS